MTIDPDKYKRALSCFATGVAVVTTTREDSTPVGMTISSFNSVSLEPPLVLWSIARDAYNYDHFIRAKYFAVNVLTTNQQELSDRFAKSSGGKFANIEFASGVGGVPILTEYAARFECETEYCYEGGDHQIIVGRVLEFEDRETDPLIFYHGRYLDGKRQIRSGSPD